MTELRKNYLTDETSGATASVDSLGQQSVVIRDETSGTAAMVSDTGQLHVVMRGVQADNNSTETPLGGGATFTGTATDVLDYSYVFVNVYSDQASATDGLVIQQSQDGAHWRWDDKYTIQASSGKTFSIQPAMRYIRVQYTNGAVAQTEFELIVTLKKGASLPSSHRIADSIVDDDDAELVTNVNKAKTPAGTFVNIGATASGNLKVANVENGLSIAKGDVTGHSFIHKFGAAPDFDTADGAVTVWDGAADGVAWENMVYDYSATADIDSISSDDQLNDVGITLEIQGLDSNYDLVVQTATLDATDARTRVALSTSLIRVFRVKNTSSTGLTGRVVVYPNTALTAGVPTDKSKIRAIVHPENNQTEMAVFTIPDGYTCYMRSWYAAAAGANKSTNYIVRVKARPFGQVFQLKHRSALSDIGTSYIQHTYVEPEVFAAKTDIEMTVEMTAGGGTGGAVAGGFDLVLVAD